MPPINPQGILFIQGVLGRAKLHLMRHYIDPRVRAVHAVSATDVAYKSIADKIVDFEKESKALHFVRNNIEDDNKALPPQPGCSKCALCDQEVWNKSSNHVYCRVARQERTFRMAPSPTKDCDNWSEPIQDFACENTIVGITVVGRGLDAASCGVAMGMAKMTCDTTVDGHGHERSSHVRHSTLRFNEEVTMYVEGRMATLGHHRKEIPMTLTEQNVGDRVKASTSDSGATTKASRDWDTIAVPLPSLLYFVVRVMVSLFWRTIQLI